MHVAFTTSNGALIDGNFRTSKSFTVWDIGPHEAYYVTTVCITSDSRSEEEQITLRAEALKECALVCAAQVSGPAAAKLVARNIHPLKTGSSVTVEKIIGKLQEVLSGSPPPWLRKAHDKGAYGRSRDHGPGCHAC